jgi:dolichol kinase
MNQLLTAGTARQPRSISDSELFLILGNAVRARVRLRIPLETVAQSVGLSPFDCILALAFAEGSDRIKLRAMVEDWSWAEIKEHVCVQLGLLDEDLGQADAVDTRLVVPPGISRSEALRRLWHMLPGLLPFLLTTIPHPHPLPWDALFRIAGLAVVLTSALFVTYRWIARPDERSWVLNAVSYPGTVLLTLLAFPGHPEFAGVVLTVLAFGDGSATLMGMLFGWRPLPWNPRKTWVGTSCFLLLASPIAAMAYWVEARPQVSWVTAVACGLAASFIAALAESLPVRITDNLRVGLAAAFGVVLAHWATFSIF